MDHDASETRLHLEAELSQPDFVMESRVTETVVDYIKAGGQAQTVVELLSDNYKGYAHMASLVCRWLKSTEEEGDAMEAPSTSYKEGGKGELLDELTFLQEFARQRFDPEKFSRIFTQGGSGPPPWLDGLISSHRGRRLIYDLSAQHRNCLLLNFAIQKIYQGHEDEVAAVGSSLSSYFGVFHRLLAARLKAAATAASGRALDPTSSGSAASLLASANNSGNFEHLGQADSRHEGAAGGAEHARAREHESLGQSRAGQQRATQDPGVQLTCLASELKDSTTLSQHTYVHAQQLLAQLARYPGGGGAVFWRLSQELEAHAAADHPETWCMMPLFVDARAPDKEVEAATLVGRLLTNAPRLNMIDTVLLAKLYGNPGGSTENGPDHAPGYTSERVEDRIGHSSSRPPLRYIRHPQLVQLLVSSVFVPGKTLSPDVVSHVMDLLALACAGSEQDPCGVDEGGDAMDAEQDARLHDCITALNKALELAARMQAGLKMSSKDWEEAVQVANVPIAAHGLMHFTRAQLSVRDYYHEAAVVGAVPGFLRLALLVARTHADMVPQVILVIEAALVALGSLRLELSRLACDTLVAVLRDCGAVERVMESVDRWGGGADPSLLRYFIFQTLLVLGPPYSSTFAGWLLRLSVKSGIRRGRDGPRGSKNAALLESFAAECGTLQNELHLNAKEMAFLQELMT